MRNRFQLGTFLSGAADDFQDFAGFMGSNWDAVHGELIVYPSIDQASRQASVASDSPGQRKLLICIDADVWLDRTRGNAKAV